jgi:hypothetical protein
MRKLLLLSLLGLSFLTGCATLNAISSTVAVALADGIEFGTAEYISHHATGAPAQTALAVKIKAIAVQVEGFNNGTVTVAQIDATIAADIAKLSVADQILANGLLQELVIALGVQTQKGLISAAASADIAVVLNAVIAACGLYGA